MDVYSVFTLLTALSLFWASSWRECPNQLRPRIAIAGVIFLLYFIWIGTSSSGVLYVPVIVFALPFIIVAIFYFMRFNPEAAERFLRSRAEKRGHVGHEAPDAARSGSRNPTGGTTSGRASGACISRPAHTVPTGDTSGACPECFPGEYDAAIATAVLADASKRPGCISVPPHTQTPADNRGVKCDVCFPVG